MLGTPDFPRSPTFLISQLPDPTFVSQVCHPFMHCDIAPDSLNMDFIQDSLIPNIKKQIAEHDFQAMRSLPMIAKLIVDNLDRQGLTLLNEEIFPELYRCILLVPRLLLNDMIALVAEVICKISSRYRDDLMIDVIALSSTASETRLRILAAYLIPLVRESDRVLEYFQSLSEDPSAQVRIEVIKSLPNVCYDESITRSILLDAVRDVDAHINCAAACVFGEVAPQLISDYAKLLRNRATCRCALRGFTPVVIENGLRELISDFVYAAELEPEACASVLLDLAKDVDECDIPLFMDAVMKVRETETMLEHMGTVVAVIPDKDFFADVLDPTGITDWRVRKKMLLEAVKLVGVIDSTRMIELANKFSHDDVADVRNMCVGLWCHLIKTDPESIKSVKMLSDESWQSRLLLVKVIEKIEKEVPAFTDSIRQLSHDCVSNVRAAVAHMLQVHGDTEMITELFGSSSDTV